MFFERTNNKLLAKFTKEKNPKNRKGNTHINTIKDRKWENTTDRAEIQTILRNQLENLCSNKLENLEKREIFLNTCELPKLNKEDIKTLTRPITDNELKGNNKKLLTKKTQDSMDSLKNSTRTSRKNPKSLGKIFKIFIRKLKGKECCQNHSWKQALPRNQNQTQTPEQQQQQQKPLKNKQNDKKTVGQSP